MNQRAEVTTPDSTLRAFAEGDDEGAFRLFAQLCRASPGLRDWLWEEFARKPRTRAKIAAHLASPSGEGGIGAFVENGPLHLEAATLRENISARIYGGLTWSEVEALIRHYQAGKLDLGTFLLVSEWRRVGDQMPPSPRLMAATVDWFGTAVRSGDSRLLRHVGKTLGLLTSLEKAPKRRGLFGHTAWWKLNLLFYILRHPKESYRTREFRACLADLGVEVGTKDIRRFCSRHGIRRDVRAGRPRRLNA